MQRGEGQEGIYVEWGPEERRHWEGGETSRKGTRQGTVSEGGHIMGQES